jgi:hypothetical protein
MKKFLTNKKLIYTLSLIFVGIIIGILIGASYFRAHRDVVGTDASSTHNNDQVVQKLISDLSKLMILPADDSPVVATINDAATLAKDQPFYVNSVNGDALLVFPKSSKAVIYSPSRNVIVNVGFISQEQGTSTAQTGASQIKSATNTTTSVLKKK